MHSNMTNFHVVICLYHYRQHKTILSSFLCYHSSYYAYAFKGSTPSSKVSNECLDNLFIEPYHGTVHVTNTGHLCQPWARQTPHTHTRTNDADFPYDGSVQEASNYCRDFGEFRGRPFCYTIDPGVRWGYCTFVICNSKLFADEHSYSFSFLAN